MNDRGGPPCTRRPRGATLHCVPLLAESAMQPPRTPQHRHGYPAYAVTALEGIDRLGFHSAQPASDIPPIRCLRRSRLCAHNSHLRDLGFPNHWRSYLSRFIRKTLRSNSQHMRIQTVRLFRSNPAAGVRKQAGAQPAGSSSRLDSCTLDARFVLDPWSVCEYE